MLLQYPEDYQAQNKPFLLKSHQYPYQRELPRCEYFMYSKREKTIITILILLQIVCCEQLQILLHYRNSTCKIERKFAEVKFCRLTFFTPQFVGFFFVEHRWSDWLNL